MVLFFSGLNFIGGFLACLSPWDPGTSSNCASAQVPALIAVACDGQLAGGYREEDPKQAGQNRTTSGKKQTVVTFSRRTIVIEARQ